MTATNATKSSKENKNINEADVCDRLPVDLKHLFKYTIRIGYYEEPKYDFIISNLTHLRDRSLKNEGITNHMNNIPSVKPNPLQPPMTRSSKVISRVNHKSINSKVQMSGMELKMNTITTLQGNKTLNSINYTNCSKS
jgi:hypothetical protein